MCPVLRQVFPVLVCHACNNLRANYLTANSIDAINLWFSVRIVVSPETTVYECQSRGFINYGVEFFGKHGWVFHLSRCKKGNRDQSRSCQYFVNDVHN